MIRYLFLVVVLGDEVSYRGFILSNRPLRVARTTALVYEICTKLMLAWNVIVLVESTDCVRNPLPFPKNPQITNGLVYDR